jgi:hypothetical protein
MPTDEQVAAATAAAPYLHPKLASNDTRIIADNTHRVISDAPLTARMASALRCRDARARGTGD